MFTAVISFFCRGIYGGILNVKLYHDAVYYNSVILSVSHLIR